MHFQSHPTFFQVHFGIQTIGLLSLIAKNDQCLIVCFLDMYTYVNGFVFAEPVLMIRVCVS